MGNWITVIAAMLYLALLFGVAWYTEKKSAGGRSLINKGWIYALSLAVYCTAWTYYGSVGRAATNGIDFLAIYLGPTLVCILFWPLLRRILRICRQQRINSIADFISTRYGKNFSLAVIVTLICIIGIIPYISLQLKAISASFHILTGTKADGGLPFGDTTLYFTILISIFIIFFGTRSVDASEKHEGLVAAIALESIVKLVAFILAGVFICYGMFSSPSAIFEKAMADPELSSLFTLGKNGNYTGWISLILLSMMAMLFLPRQFQVNIVENLEEKHLRKASWMFPLYLFIINLFVLPIALAGKLLLPVETDADFYVLSLPLSQGHGLLGLFIFIGGFSAATSMIIVETIALTTMVSNNLALPLFLNRMKESGPAAATRTIIGIRRISVFLILLIAYLYDITVAEKFSLVSMGLISFAAVAQLAPAALLGMFWKQATKTGAIAGMITGFIVWAYTLIIPSVVNAGLLPAAILEEGPFGVHALRPYALLGMDNMDSITHALFWSMLSNVGMLILVSNLSRRSANEIYQAELYAQPLGKDLSQQLQWRSGASMASLQHLLQTFLGEERSGKILAGFANRHKIDMQSKTADARLVDFSERVLSGIIGSASAKIMVGSIAKAAEPGIDEVVNMLKESQQVMMLNKELKKKSQELTRATDELRRANAQLRELDSQKDEFLYTVTHELRTPLTSVRALAEIVHDNPDMPEEQKQHYLSTAVRETERLSHLITQVLNLERYESGRQRLNIQSVDMGQLIEDVLDSADQLLDARRINVQKNGMDSMMLVQCDQDLIRQVLYNLISNAIKFTPEGGIIRIATRSNYDELEVWVEDTGKGIEEDLRELIFDKFFQARNQTLKKPEGSGLGLAICRRIIEMHNGSIRAENNMDGGATFVFTLPTIKAYSLNG